MTPTHAQLIANVCEQFDQDADDAERARKSAARIADLITENRANVATIHQLQDALAETNQDNEILRGELASARQALGWMVAE